MGDKKGKKDVKLLNQFSQIKIILLSMWDSAVPFKYSHRVWFLFGFYHTIISRNLKKTTSLWEVCLSLCNISAIYQRSEPSGFLTSCSLQFFKKQSGYSGEAAPKPYHKWTFAQFGQIITFTVTDTATVILKSMFFIDPPQHNLLQTEQNRKPIK